MYVNVMYVKTKKSMFLKIVLKSWNIQLWFLYTCVDCNKNDRTNSTKRLISSRVHEWERKITVFPPFDFRAEKTSY